MLKPVLFVALLLGVGAVSAACPTGATCGAATKYEVSVVSAALCQNSSCTSPVNLGSSARSFDIASASVGSAIGAYANFDSVSAGTYTHVQVVISRTLTLSGAVSGAVPACTVSSAQLSVPNANASLTTAMAALGITWNDEPTRSQLKVITALPQALAISKTAPMPDIAVKFGTATGLMCLLNTPYPAPPDVSVAIQ